MRPIIAFGILLLGLSSAAPEPEYSSLFADSLYADSLRATGLAPLVEIESSTGRSDRLTVTPLQPRALAVERVRRDNADGSVSLASADPDFYTGSITTAGTQADGNHPAEVSLDDLCNALFNSAQDNDLPIPFFANLIWQESRLRDDAVSAKGAMGIAQFMPEAAEETGLSDPFDPLQAIPASARFLQRLRLQFGNLGFVAAAYNAGAHRVADWLQHRQSLPRETRNYVVRVTGLSVEAWRKMPVDNDSLTFVRHLPCRSLPAFANVEQAQLELAQSEQAKIAEQKRDEPANEDAPAAHDAPKHAAERRHERPHERREARRATHERHSTRREAEHTHGARDKHKSA